MEAEVVVQDAGPALLRPDHDQVRQRAGPAGPDVGTGGSSPGAASASGFTGVEASIGAPSG